MQSRQHYLEIALQQAIEKKDFDVAIKLTAMIQENRGLAPASLESLDGEGRSFLCHALASGATEIADALLELQQHSDIIFTQDDTLRSPLHYAIASGYLDITEKIIRLAARREPAVNCEVWLRQDDYGRTPLHYACNKNYSTLVSLLLEKIIQEPDAINILNLVDRDGNTALHLACEMSVCESAELMVRFGADPFVKNDVEMMPLTNTDPETVAYIARNGGFIGKDLPASFVSVLSGICQRMKILLLDASIQGVPLTFNNRIEEAIIYAKPASVVASDFSAEEQDHILTYCKQALVLNPDAKEISQFILP